jgi:hypothetical protein
MADDSTDDVRRTLAGSMGNRCSNPDCRTALKVAQVGTPQGLDVGVVVQIGAVDASSHPDNGIWLCQNCASLVGNNPTQYPEVLLRAWKTVAEHHARFPIARKPFDTQTPSPVLPESESKLKTLAILPWRNKIVTLSESIGGDTAMGLGPGLVYSQAQVVDCTESHVTISRGGRTESLGRRISLENVELRIDATANQLELRVRCA